MLGRKAVIVSGDRTPGPVVRNLWGWVSRGSTPPAAGPTTTATRAGAHRGGHVGEGEVGGGGGVVGRSLPLLLERDVELHHGEGVEVQFAEGGVWADMAGIDLELVAEEGHEVVVDAVHGRLLGRSG